MKVNKMKVKTTMIAREVKEVEIKLPYYCVTNITEYYKIINEKECIKIDTSVSFLLLGVRSHPDNFINMDKIDKSEFLTALAVVKHRINEKIEPTTKEDEEDNIELKTTSL